MAVALDKSIVEGKKTLEEHALTRSDNVSDLTYC